MNTMYLDVTGNHCTSVFIKDTRVIPAGTTIYSMSMKEERAEYDLLAEKYGIHFIFDDHIPAVDFYAVPQVDIMATDGAGGFFGTIGEVSGLDSQAPVCYIDQDRNCFLIAPDFRNLLEHLDHWRENAVPYEEITLFSSREEAMRKHKFVDLSTL